MPLKSNCNHIVFIMEGKQKKNTFRFENTSLRFTIVEHIVLRIINLFLARLGGAQFHHCLYGHQPVFPDMYMLCLFVCLVAGFAIYQ